MCMIYLSIAIVLLIGLMFFLLLRKKPKPIVGSISTVVVITAVDYSNISLDFNTTGVFFI